MRNFEGGRTMASQIKPPRGSLQLVMASVLAILGMILLFSGFWVPPQGDIEASVLVAYGEVMTFAAALYGIDYHYRHRQ